MDVQLNKRRTSMESKTSYKSKNSDVIFSELDNENKEMIKKEVDNDIMNNQKVPLTRWTANDDNDLRKAIMKHGSHGSWDIISKELFDNERSGLQCKNRWEKILSPGLIKGPWTMEEDEIVKRCVIQDGITKWSIVAKYVPGRIGKQCRERWMNHLDPSLSKQEWGEEEDRILMDAHKEIGSHWSKIAKLLPGRSENSVKNRWNSRFRSKETSMMKKQHDKIKVITNHLDKTSSTKAITHRVKSVKRMYDNTAITVSTAANESSNPLNELIHSIHDDKEDINRINSYSDTKRSREIDPQITQESSFNCINNITSVDNNNPNKKARQSPSNRSSNINIDDIKMRMMNKKAHIDSYSSQRNGLRSVHTMDEHVAILAMTSLSDVSQSQPQTPPTSLDISNGYGSSTLKKSPVSSASPVHGANTPSRLSALLYLAESADASSNANADELNKLNQEYAKWLNYPGLSLSSPRSPVASDITPNDPYHAAAPISLHEYSKLNYFNYPLNAKRISMQTCISSQGQ